MKDIINKIKTRFRSISKLWRKAIADEGSDALAYSSLSPIDNIKDDDGYLIALKWAIDNRKEKDIKNIALTGPYGSGKSSVLKTFQKDYKGKDLHFLNISLATFKDEKVNQQQDDKGKEELLRLIEISILQQIFYRETDKNIPDSRFKRIISFGKRKLILITIGAILFILALVNLSFPDFIQRIFRDYPFSNSLVDILHYGSVVAILFGGAFLISKSIRIISSLTIRKLAFQNAEIGIEKEVNKSILNHHLDEILYFFRVRPYNVVVIENLDRFEETEIFTKLREINLLLNSSQNTRGKRIVFIYAVRDDMFLDNERIKFFDFIIPIIPVINSYNSNEILLEKKKTHCYQITDDFIEDISYFIDDMRLLHNISNEFFLYRNKLDVTLSEDKLFAIITYKNKYPNDFDKLCKNQGSLYDILNSKSNYISDEIKMVEDQIRGLKKDIDNIDSNSIESVEELRMVYILRVIDLLGEFYSFVRDGNTIGIDHLVLNGNFIQLRKGILNYKPGYNTYVRSVTNVASFSAVEKKVNPNKTYETREKEILDRQSGRTNQLKKDIKELERKKLKIKGAKFSDLLQSDEQKISDFKELDPDFINILLRNGYIQEDYLDYVSIFHEGSITRKDHKFVLSVKTRQPLSFDYELSKVESTIKKINIHEFGSEYVFNKDLLEYLLRNENHYPDHLDLVFSKLKDESESSIKFFKYFFENSGEMKPFFKYLCKHWGNIWSYIEEKSVFPDEDKRKVFEYILDFAEVSSIVEIAKDSKLEKKILEDPEFLTIIPSQEKLKEIFQELELLFTSLDFDSSPDELLEYILENNHYDLIPEMLRGMILKFGEYDEETFENANYSAIKESKCDNLISYVEEFIDEYISKTFLEIENSNHESEESLFELLGNAKVSVNNKKAIIRKTETKITDVSQVENRELVQFAFSENRVEPTWENMLDDFRRSENEISSTVVDFINRIENAEELGKSVMPIVVTLEEEGEEFEYQELLILKEEIEDQPYAMILGSVKERYNDLPFESLSKEKVKQLVVQDKLEPTIENYRRLKGKFNLNLLFFESYLNEFLEFHSEGQFKLDSIELNSILKSSRLSSLQKATVLGEYSLEEITKKGENLSLIARMILKGDNKIEVKSEIYDEILTDDIIPISDRIDLFALDYMVESISIDDFLLSLGENYAVISNKKKKAKIDDTQMNRKLLETLERAGYISSFSEKPAPIGGLIGTRKLMVNHKRK